ncbi:hypothetical protein Trydic_g1889 [Trypoxylus dichotomus]
MFNLAEPNAHDANTRTSQELSAVQAVLHFHVILTPTTLRCTVSVAWFPIGDALSIITASLINLGAVENTSLSDYDDRAVQHCRNNITTATPVPANTVIPVRNERTTHIRSRKAERSVEIQMCRNVNADAA